MNIDLTSSKRIHSMTIPMRWGDMDAMGHLNNAMYFRFMEECRLNWFLTVGTDLTQTQGIGAVIVNAFCEFLKPITYPANVELTMHLGERGRTSAQTHHAFIVNGEIYARGAAKIVWIDLLTGKSAPLPQKVVALYD
jgi:acyl-CoA thioester hydrolase